MSAGLASTLEAQDTSARQQDTSKTAAVDSSSTDSTKWGYAVESTHSQQNPPGYRGMERPSGLTDSTKPDSIAPADATNRVNQMKRQDSLGNANQNPPGYRGMERPASVDSAMGQRTDTTSSPHPSQKAAGKSKQATTKSKTKAHASRDSSAQDSTKWGYKVERNPQVQNPAGYRGMERPVNVFPPDSAKPKKSASASATSRVSQMKRQDSMAGGRHQNPPGYRGMERPAGLDSAQQKQIQDSANQSGAPRGDQNRAAARQTDTTSTVRAGRDTTADSTRFGVKAAEEGSPGITPRPADSTSLRDDSTSTQNRSDIRSSRDSTDIVHQERETAPGMGHQPPPYPADSERVWVQQRPGNDSVAVNGSSQQGR